MEPGYHLTLGPATILYRDQDRANGPVSHAGHLPPDEEAGARRRVRPLLRRGNLTGAGQKYIYFLVRDDGKYLIKRREGENTSEITKGWTASSAIKKGDPQGRATNLLEIDAKQDPT